MCDLYLANNAQGLSENALRVLEYYFPQLLHTLICLGVYDKAVPFTPLQSVFDSEGLK